MKVCRPLFWTLILAAGLGTQGCDRHEEGHARHERGDDQRPPQQVVQQQQPTQVFAQQPQVIEPQPQYVVVPQAPPAVIVEQQPPAPTGLHVWVNGYWNWDNQRYSWQAGHYVVPPQPDVAWVAPHYENDSHRYTPGQWTKHHPANNRDHERNSK